MLNTPNELSVKYLYLYQPRACHLTDRQSDHALFLGNTATTDSIE